MYWTPLFCVAGRLCGLEEAPLGGRECGKGRVVMGRSWGWEVWEGCVGREVVSGRFVGWELRWCGPDHPVLRSLGSDLWLDRGG